MDRIKHRAAGAIDQNADCLYVFGEFVKLLNDRRTRYGVLINEETAADRAEDMELGGVRVGRLSYEFIPVGRRDRPRFGDLLRLPSHGRKVTPARTGVNALFPRNGVILCDVV